MHAAGKREQTDIRSVSGAADARGEPVRPDFSVKFRLDRNDLAVHGQAQPSTENDNLEGVMT